MPTLPEEEKKRRALRESIARQTADLDGKIESFGRRRAEELTREGAELAEQIDYDLSFLFSSVFVKARLCRNIAIELCQAPGP